MISVRSLFSPKMMYLSFLPSLSSWNVSRHELLTPTPEACGGARSRGCQPSQTRGAGDDERGGPGLDEEIVGRHAGHGTEQETCEVGAERRRAGDEDHAQGQHPDEQQPDRGVLAEAGAPPDEADAADHHRLRHGGEHLDRHAVHDGVEQDRNRPHQHR